MNRKQKTTEKQERKKKKNCPLQGMALLPPVDSVGRQSADLGQSKTASQQQLHGRVVDNEPESLSPLTLRLASSFNAGNRPTQPQQFPGPCVLILSWEPPGGLSCHSKSQAQ